MTASQFSPAGPLRGTLRLPGDKSISHRALLFAALAPGRSRITGLSDGDDVVRTAGAVSAMGAVVDGNHITGGVLHRPDGTIDCGNSGTGIRLLAGWCAPRPWETTLTGDASVRRRPMDRVVEPLRDMGAVIETVDGRAPLIVRGRPLRGIDHRMQVASAQVKSAILIAGLDAEGETIIREPVPTRAHTEEMLAAAGADIETADGVVRLRPSTLTPFSLDVPGDPSQAAFWVVAATIIEGSELILPNVYIGRARAGFLDVLARMGADIAVTPTGDHGADLRVRSAPLRATEVGGAEVAGLIDEIPVLGVAAAMAEGVTVFRDAAELKVKETDRIASMTAALSAVGVAVEATEDGMAVTGGRISGGTISSQGDHRVAMAMAVAGLAATDTVRVEGWDAVATSYPGFQEDLRSCLS